MPTPLLVLQLRAEARAILFANFVAYESFEEAADPLWNYAVRKGVVKQVGEEAVVEMIVGQFKKALEFYCYEHGGTQTK